MDERNLQSSHMKAKARLARYKNKKMEGGEEAFGQAWIRAILQDPVMLAGYMKVMPEQMNRLIKKYGQEKE